VEGGIGSGGADGGWELGKKEGRFKIFLLMEKGVTWIKEGTGPWEWKREGRGAKGRNKERGIVD